jgi:hypothetical protein
MKRAIILPALVTAFVALSPAAAALATPSPNGPGQPNVSIGEPAGGVVVGPGPQGFQTSGFANAETHYAGSDGTPSLANGNPRAVSQYDVAAYQLTPGVHQHH